MSLLPGRDRAPFRYDAFVPDPLADLAWSLPLDLAARLSEAEALVSNLDHRAGHFASLEAISRLLLRSEAVSSSRIEGLQVGHRRLAEALFDPVHSRDVERAVVGNVRALEHAVHLGGSARRWTAERILEIHHVLLESTHPTIAGRFRAEQAWLGSGPTPRTARFVPPPEDEVPRLVQDLVAYCNREDVPPLVQAAIAHAQFETIHPFADGNGRVGRCLIHAVLRRRGLVENYVPPISVVLAANADTYIDGLVRFREGDLERWCALFADATRASVEGATSLVAAFDELENEWMRRANRPRSRSSAQRLISRLPGIPVIDVRTVATDLGVSFPAANSAVVRLERAGILRPLREDARRDRRWLAPQVFGLLDSFDWLLATSDLGGRRSRRPAPSPTTASPRRLLAVRNRVAPTALTADTTPVPRRGTLSAARAAASARRRR